MSHKFTLGQAVVFSPGAREILNVATRSKIARQSDGLQRRALEHQLRPVIAFSRH